MTDEAGNSINVTQEITVNDTTNPTASDPAPINVQCSADVPDPDVTVVTDEADNCTSNPTVAFVSDSSDGNANPEIITRTYSVTDEAGNSINVTQEITVNDTTNPTASNPAPINVQCSADVPDPDVTVVTDEADNCTNNPTVAFVSDSSDGNSNPEIITRTYSVTDEAGNSINVTQEITVNDTTNPTASNPAAINVQCEVPEPDITVVTDEADNCTTNPTVAFVSDSSDGNFNPEVITRTYSVSDDAGNSINVTQKITIKDTQAPDIPVLEDIVSECPLTIEAPVTTDNCDGEVTGTTGLTELSFESSETVYWIFTDASGNQTETVEQKVIINNDIAPVPDETSLPTKEIRGCQISSLSDLEIPTATDNCEGAIDGKLSEDFVFPFSFSGTQIIVWEYTDSQGNTATQEQEIKLIPEDINGGILKGTFGSTEFEHQIDISSCGDQISVALNLTGEVGSIMHWEKYAVNKGVWEEISNNSNSYTATFAAGAFESTYYRVLIQVGTCIEYSDTFYIRALPPGAPPTVTNQDDDNLYCLGEDVNLVAASNYLATQDAIPDSSGDFNQGQLNTQDPDGWLVDGDPGGFTAGGNARKPKNWSATNDHEFGDIVYDSEEKKFAIAQGDFSSNQYKGNTPTTLESPILDLSNAESASLDFDQAYYFANNDIATIEISTDGGNTYSSLKIMHSSGGGVKDWYTAGTAESTAGSDPTHFYFNTDNTSISLEDYLGESEVRIRWSFTGTSDKSVWAMDNIFINKKIPVDTELEWTEGIGDPNENPIETGRTEVPINFIPDTPGIQQYGATALINACRTYSEEGTDLIDLYISYSYAGEDIIYTSEDCGHNQVQLNAYDNTITARENIDKGAFETPASGCRECDAPGTGDIGEWSWAGDSSSCGEVSFSDIHDPDAIFSAPAGTYTLTWTVAGCSNDVVVTITECDKIDFDGINDHIDFGDNYDLNGDFSLEFWVKPNATDGTRTIFSKRDGSYSGTAKGYDLSIKDGTVYFNWDKSGSINSSPYKVDTSRWYHIAVTHSSSGEYRMYVDGINLKVTGGGAPSENAYRAILGAMDSTEPAEPLNYLSGWIDEIRIWDVSLSPEQLHIMMNQRLQESGTNVTGEVIPIQIPNLQWNDLHGYYRMDEIGIGCGNITPAVGVEGKIINITTPQENTAPLPYISNQSGSWRDKNTWLRPSVWDVPNAKGINGDDIKWNIAETSHDIYSTTKNIYMLGLISHSGELEMDGNVDSQTGQGLTITHYLKLDGSINLEGESQLVQTEGSILDEASSGYLDRDQQGVANSYNYNYWSSPVSLTNSGVNYGFKIGEVLNDGTDPNNLKEIDFNYQYTWADYYNFNSGNKRISTYWLYTFGESEEDYNGEADDYFEWHQISEDDLLPPGIGYSMKGTSGGVNLDNYQNYIFRGLPNNGDITLTVGAGQNKLIGNPYPSAINGEIFLDDNLNSLNGALYFWDHFGKVNSHVLEEYIGGYAVFNKSGSIPAISNDERINSENSYANRNNKKYPGKYIPVGQGFFISTAQDDIGNSSSGGQIIFRNAQRYFATENDGDSQFLGQVSLSKNQKNDSNSSDKRHKIRLHFSSPKGYHRQILVTADSNTTTNFDLGYDAPLIENNVEDMYWIIDDTEFVIQAVPDFNKDLVLPLGIKIDKTGEYSIGVEKLENIEGDFKIYLHDKLDNTYHSLEKESFSSEAEPGLIDDRFEIVFSKPLEVGEVSDPEKPGIPEIPRIPDLDISDGLEMNYLRTPKEIVLTNPSLLKIEHIELFSLNGKRIGSYNGIPIQRSITLPVKNEVSSAVYIVRVYTKEKIYSKKIIIND